MKRMIAHFASSEGWHEHQQHNGQCQEIRSGGFQPAGRCGEPAVVECSGGVEDDTGQGEKEYLSQAGIVVEPLELDFASDVGTGGEDEYGADRHEQDNDRGDSMGQVVAMRRINHSLLSVLTRTPVSFRGRCGAVHTVLLRRASGNHNRISRSYANC